jgi:hypothetical protein
MSKNKTFSIERELENEEKKKRLSPRRYLVVFLLVLLIGTFSISCKPLLETFKLNNLKKNAKVYIVLTETSNDNALTVIRTYIWKNGETQTLGTIFRDLNWEETTFGIPNVRSVFVHENDVYLISIDRSTHGFGYSSYLYKNGERQLITDNASFSPQIFVSQNDVYLVGTWELEDMYTNTTTLWKNGVFSKISGILPSSVFVSDDNLYIVGWSGCNHYPEATAWYNNRSHFLRDNSSGGNSHANSIYVHQNNVYVAGTTGFADYDDIDYELNSKPRATLWVNGVPQTLSNQNSGAIEVIVDDKFVYVLGYTNVPHTETGSIVLWKNGEEHVIFTEMSQPAMYVFHGDVYIVGNQTGKTVLWKNGIIQTISENLSERMRIFVM